MVSELVAVTHIHLSLNIDFIENKLKGRADLTIDQRSKETFQLVSREIVDIFFCHNKVLFLSFATAYCLI